MDRAFDLYEQITLEMLEVRETDTVRSLIKQSKPLLRLKEQQPQRYSRLEQLLIQGTTDPSEVDILYKI